MSWQTISEDFYKEYYDSPFARAHPDQFYNVGFITLEYDDAATTTTSVKLRFKFDARFNLYDKYYALLNPTKDNRKLIALKTEYTNTEIPNWPYYSPSFTISKSATSKTFTIPELWICNNGSDNLSDATEAYNTYKSGGGRHDLTSEHEAKNISIAESVTVATDGTAPSIYIKDNKNNTVTISGELGQNGKHNNIQYAAVYYTTDGSDPGNSENTKRKRVLYYSADSSDNHPSPISGGSYSTTISITSSCTIRATVRCAFEHNTTEANTDEKITYYSKLGNPGVPVLTEGSKRNGRIVTKNPWTFIWTPTQILTSTLTIAGYKYILKRMPKGTTVWETTVSNSTTGSSITFNDPAALGFIAGDKFKLLIQAYAIDGNNNTIYSDAVESIEYTVQNAGVVNVKINNTWKEGQVYVKVSGYWREAETVNVKVGGVWKESQ